MKPRAFEPHRAFLPLVLLSTAASGCLTEVTRPEEASFTLDAAQEVQVVTSTNFRDTSDGVELVEADTVIVTGAHGGTVALTPAAIFYIGVTSFSDENLVSMEVFVGQKQRFDDSRTLAADEAIQFVYGFGSL